MPTPRLMQLSMLSLNAIRAFAAAASHQSFTRAAVELHVTHSAVSRQIKALEEFLGVALFERRIRQVSLTVEGQQLYAEVKPALQQISAAAQALMARKQASLVTINVRPSFAVRWLIPRLPDFVALHPNIEPQVLTRTSGPDQAPEHFDIAIRRGLEHWPPTIEPRPFLEDEGLIVAAPALLTAHPILEPRSLAAHVLLSARTRAQDWDAWKKHQGLARLRPKRLLQFDHLHFVLQAAVDGLGFAVAPHTLVAHDLDNGRLCCPLPGLRLPLPRHYYGVAPDATAQSKCFAHWLDGQLRGYVASSAD